jgi:hypothetical protein
MMTVTTKTVSLESANKAVPELFDSWFDPSDSGVRERAREFIEALICGELDAALARPITGGQRRSLKRALP